MNNEYDLELTGVNRSIAVNRIIALWALSETTLGGILHALHMPLTGVFVGGAAIIFITLIAYFSEQKVSIIKATFIVLIVKGVVSPYTPVTAYFSVLLQGVLGQILFSNKKHLKLSAFVLSVTTLTVFGFQKAIIYTIVFGKTLWQSIDSYTNFIVDQFHINGEVTQTIHFSLILISIYALLHLTAGIIIGILAGKIPNWIAVSINKNDYYLVDVKPENKVKSFFEEIKKNKKSRKKKRGIVILSIAIGAIILSYLTPGLGSSLASDMVLMIFRAIVITLIWYFYLAPLLLNYSKKYLKKRQNIYAEEIEEIMTLLPQLKNVLFHCWTKSSQHKGFRKYRLFLSYSLITMLLTNFNFE
jgi:hypothetical protein